MKDVAGGIYQKKILRNLSISKVPMVILRSGILVQDDLTYISWT